MWGRGGAAIVVFDVAVRLSTTRLGGRGRGGEGGALCPQERLPMTYSAALFYLSGGRGGGGREGVRL